MMLGDFEVTALLDENSPWPDMTEQLFPTLSKQDASELAKRTKMPTPFNFSTNAFLINTGKHLILVDTGGGKFETYGKLFANMKAAGYRPEQVDDIYLTHMHGDHIGGLAENGVRNFPKATLHADQREFPESEEAAKNGDKRAQGVVSKIQPYIKAGKFKTFDGNTEFEPGVRAIASYGHTQGHSFYAFESHGQKLVLWGDFVINDKLQMERVDLPPPGEADVAKGVELRKATFAEADNEGYLVGAAHLAFPGLGRLRKIGESYVWVPVDYALPMQAKGNSAKK